MALRFKHSIGQSFVSPKIICLFENLCICVSVIRQKSIKVSPILANAMDTLFILHADHEQNASTSTVRLAGSSGANPLLV